MVMHLSFKASIINTYFNLKKKYQLNSAFARIQKYSMQCAENIKSATADFLEKKIKLGIF
ncbi:hypothetical protein BpHYR1_016137 [Brachionus plicatilis]|uniref:Uncharacterized protein n=1 Tax=Brachionus plicatilis TaxID=10195 RepID=A0A3M7QQE1_BRAPC|nr:hypothetical protein BpHYR1_016137 [Brachionus plicatilis]